MYCDAVVIRGLLVSAGDSVAVLAENNAGNVDTRLYFALIKFVFVENKEARQVEEHLAFLFAGKFFFFFSFEN